MSETPPTVAIDSNRYGLSWFCSPQPSIVWIGRTGVQYPNSHELCPLQCRPDENGSGLDREGEGAVVCRRFALNRFYYSVDPSLGWSKLNP